MAFYVEYIKDNFFKESGCFDKLEETEKFISENNLKQIKPVTKRPEKEGECRIVIC